jgi:hypothetical protein
MAMDYFMKLPEVYTIPTQEASTVVEALVTNFFCNLKYCRSYIVTSAKTLGLV